MNTPLSFQKRMALLEQRNSKNARAATGFRNSERNGIKPNASGMGQTGVNATEAVQRRLLAVPVWNYETARAKHRTYGGRSQGGGKRRQTAGGKGKRRQTRSRSRFW